MKEYKTIADIIAEISEIVEVKESEDGKYIPMIKVSGFIEYLENSLTQKENKNLRICNGVKNKDVYWSEYEARAFIEELAHELKLERGQAFKLILGIKKVTTHIYTKHNPSIRPYLRASELIELKRKEANLFDDFMNIEVFRYGAANQMTPYRAFLLGLVYGQENI